MRKRIISILIALCMVCAILPVEASAYSVENGKHGSDFASGALAERLENIFRNGISGCVKPSIPAVGKSMDNNKMYTITFANQSRTYSGQQCVAYGQAAYSYLFGYSPSGSTHEVSMRNVVAGKNSVSYNLFQELGVRCGAYMRTTINPSGDWDAEHGHSLIILSYGNSGVTTLEGNYNASGGIAILNYTWDDFNARQLRGQGRYICAFTQPSEDVYASITNDENTTPVPSNNPPEYFDCNVQVKCIDGKVVNVYNNPGDTSRVDYCSRGQSFGSTYGAKLSDGSTWYRIGAYSVALKADGDFWLKYESDKVTITSKEPDHTHVKGRYLGMMSDHPHQSCFECTICGSTFSDDTTTNTSSSCSECHTTHIWDAGKETTSATLTSPGIKTYTCTVCGETKTETIPVADAISGYGTNGKEWALTNDGILTVSSSSGIIEYPGWDMEEAERVKRIIVADGTTTLRNNPFSIFPNVTTIELPISLTTIGYGAFRDCKSLKSVYIPENVSSINDNFSGDPFPNCSSLKNISVSEKNSTYCSVDGVVYTKDMKTLVAFPEGWEGHFTVPDDVTKFTATFSECKKLTGVTLPGGITNIGQSLFSSSGVTHIVLSDGVTRIGTCAFSRCTDLKSITIPKSVTEISGDAFRGCINLTDVYYSGNAEEWAKISISGGSFENDGSLDSATIHFIELDGVSSTEPDGVDGLGNFKKTNYYYNGLFRDVAADAWYADNVSEVYQIGLMKGIGENVFAPGENVTIAQAITLAARLHSIYHTGKESFDSYDSGNWYDPYVNYARNNGILSENYNYDLPATRELFVHILAQALPKTELQPIRSEAIHFADAGSIVYASDVDLLSQAGVINGVQSGGVTKFLPQNTITRAEASAIITRMVQPKLRIS